MKSILIGTLAAVLAAGAHSNEAERQLKAAMNAELMNGDLKTAIKQYGEIVAKYQNDRAVAAAALVRMAGAYQKMGDVEASRIYERVVREFADQKEAATEARARLDSLRPKPAVAGIVNRKMWELPRQGDLFGTASADGRYIPYVDWAEGGDLFLHDLVTGTDRRLTNTATDKPGVKVGEEQYAEEYSISRDGKRLAYSWFRGDIDRYELRVLPLEGSAVPPFRTLLNDEEISWMSPQDWTPDSKWIAVQLHRKDKSAQIGLISTEDGKLRVLKSIDWRGASGMFFSADGNYLAYDLPAGDSEQQRDIYLMAADGSREASLVAHPSQDAVLGWSPDGKQLLFASDRSGSMGLWSQRVAGGLAHGSPELLKPDIGEFKNLGISSLGALHYGSSPRMGGDIQTATFDFNNLTLVSPPVQAVSTYVGSNQLPDWSPDGKYLAYSSRRRSVGSSYFVVGIRAMESGHVREFLPSPNFDQFVALNWSRDGKSLLIGGRDSKGRTGVFRMDAQTGRTSLIVATKGAPSLAEESPDAKSLYYGGRAPTGEAFACYKRDLASGEEDILFRRPNPVYASLSPDGRYLTIPNTTTPRESRGIFFVPTSGGETREVMHVNFPQLIYFLGWVPDGRSLLAQKLVDGRTVETWKVPLDGGEPVKLETKTGAGPRPWMKVHPDGKQVVFVSPVPRRPEEIWALENFLTASK